MVMKKLVLRGIRAIIIGVTAGTLLTFLPGTFNRIKDYSPLNNTLRSMHLCSYGLDTRLNYMTIFMWDKVCLVDARQGRDHLRDIQIRYAPDYAIFNSLPLFQKRDWVLLFLQSQQKKARWIPPCGSSKCIVFSKLQKEGCFSRNAVLRTVYKMNNDHKKESASLLLTEPNENLPKVKPKNLGKYQNFLEVYGE